MKTELFTIILTELCDTVAASNSPRQCLSILSTDLSLIDLSNSKLTSSDENVNRPEWIEIEKQQFLSHRDQNGDGGVDLNELREWLHPNGVPPALAEAKHLIMQSDSDKDGFLTSAEIVDNFRVFVGSQATDYGRMLHNEL